MKKISKKQLVLLMKKADLGDPKSLHELAFYHQAGINVELNYAKALKLWKKAAKKNYGPAYFNLVSMYYNGLGVKTNYKQVYKYLLLSIKYNKKNSFKAYSCSFLAQKFYFDGLLKKRDVKKGLKYYKLAAEMNELTAQFNLATIYDKEYPKYLGIKKNNKTALNYHQMAVKKNFVPSMFRVALAYIRGEIVKKNSDNALDLFKKGIKIRNLDLLKSLGYDNEIVYKTSKLINIWKFKIRKVLKQQNLIN